MKKILCLFMATVLCLSIVGCGNELGIITITDTQEKLSSKELMKVYKANEVAFEEKYVNKDIEFVATIKSISDHVYTSVSFEEGGLEVIYVPKDALSNLLAGDVVKVKGKISSDTFVDIVITAAIIEKIK